jgi:putative ABC transport system permease protein
MQILNDIRFGFRMLMKSPGFTTAVVVLLALGIGANAAIFTVASALLLHPLPYRNPQQLVSLDVKSKTNDFGGTLVRYELMRDHSQTLETAAWANDNLDMTGRGEPKQIAVARVTPNFFPVLGVQPEIGRTFSQQEGRTEGPAVVMISDALWRNQFGGDPHIVGQTVTLDTVPNEIIGVLPANVKFPFVGEPDIWTPRYFEYTLMTPQRLRMGVGYLGYVARLVPGVTAERAADEMAVMNQQYRRENPTAPDADAGAVVVISPLRELVVAGVRKKVLMLSGAVGLVLLIACANVASLLLSRALARRREIAVRVALGAARSSIVRQLLTESALLALIAGVLGVGVCWVATRALVTWGANQLPPGMPIGMDARVLLFTLVISVLTGLVFGMLPALQLSRVNVNQTLRDESRGSSGGHVRMQLGGLLVVGQVALSLVLLIGAGLLLHSFRQLLGVDPGFDAQNVLSMNVSLPTVKYAKPQQQIAFFDEVLRRVKSVPGVRSAAISAALPLTSKRITPMLPEGQAEVPLSQRPFLDIEAISPDWFQTMRVPLRMGRVFTAADDAQSHKVVIVNDAFAHRFWPNENPIGKSIVVGRGPDRSEVVGVSGDVKNKGLAQEAQAQIYVPFPQLAWANMNLLVRTSMSPESATSAVRAQIASVDPDQPIDKVQTVEELVEDSRSQSRFTMLLLGAFSVAALALAVIGIYAVLAYSVAGRRQEMAIRMALGAGRADILRLVVRQGLVMAASGIGLGLVVALLMTRLMSSMLYKVSEYDLTTFALVPMLFLVIGMVASYLPAQRATRVAPAEALRES